MLWPTDVVFKCALQINLTKLEFASFWQQNCQLYSNQNDDQQPLPTYCSGAFVRH